VEEKWGASHLFELKRREKNYETEQYWSQRNWEKARRKIEVPAFPESRTSTLSLFIMGRGKDPGGVAPQWSRWRGKKRRLATDLGIVRGGDHQAVNDTNPLKKPIPFPSQA